MSEYGKRTREAVAQIIARDEAGPALEQARVVDDLARYLGEQGTDLYDQLDGDEHIDASFLRTVAAEQAEQEGWDFDAIVRVIQILADLGLVLLGGSQAAMIEASFTTAIALIGEVT